MIIPARFFFHSLSMCIRLNAVAQINSFSVCALVAVDSFCVNLKLRKRWKEKTFSSCERKKNCSLLWHDMRKTFIYTTAKPLDFAEIGRSQKTIFNHTYRNRYTHIYTHQRTNNNNLIESIDFKLIKMDTVRFQCYHFYGKREKTAT